MAAMTCTKCGAIVRFPAAKNGTAGQCEECGEVLRLVDDSIETTLNELRKQPSQPSSLAITSAIFAAVATAAISIVFMLRSDATVEGTSAPTGSVPALEWLVDPQGSSGELAGSITGKLKNNGPNLSYVQVEFSLYDSTGARVGSAVAAVNNLETGEEWKFHAFAPNKFASFKLAGLTGF